MITKKGINAAPGVAIGPALVLDAEEYRISRRTVDATDTPRELRVLAGGLEAARQEVADLRDGASRKLGAQTAGIFAFHESFIADPRLRSSIEEMIQTQNFSAAYAFATEMNRRQRQFSELNDPYLKERVRDLFDIERRVLRHILGRAREDVRKLSQPVILVAPDITPSDMVTFDRKNILAICTEYGGATSHTAIIARQLGIPAVVGISNLTADVSGSETVVIDGTRGVVVISPDDETVARYRVRQTEYEEFVRQLSEIRDLPSVTADGQKITLMANIELAEEARHAMDSSAEGIGLYRTEFLFLGKDRLPTEEQQFEVFRGAVRHARGQPIVIRTIDLGAEKMARFMGAQRDPNPDLGLRSLRYCLQHLDMFKTHLRAILRAAVDGDVRIMFPMITTLMELRQAKATIADVMEDLEEDGVPFRKEIPLGIMVETPSAALMASAFARESAFISIGTNDLTQYTLAVDRANERVAHLYAPHNPAVLRLIREIVRAGRRNQTAIALCGEMAGQPVYAQILLGLGLRTLSMAPKDIPAVKKIIRSTTIPECEAIARKALRLDADRQVMSFLRDELRKIDPEAM